MFSFKPYIQVCNREDHPWSVIVKLEGEPYNRESYQMVSYNAHLRRRVGYIALLMLVSRWVGLSVDLIEK